jgi:uncharacterized membrane protein
MESRAKFLGHPVHQMLVPFPLGLLAASFVFDMVYLRTDNGRWSDIAYWLIVGGVGSGALAAVFGWIDWFKIPGETRAKSIGLRHGIGNVIVLVLFALSLYFRADDPRDPAVAAVVLSGLGVLLSFGTAWLGGELVDRLGVGVDEGAHLDAPSSLRRRARE